MKISIYFVDIIWYSFQMLIACLVFLLLTTNLIKSKYPKQSRTYVNCNSILWINDSWNLVSLHVSIWVKDSWVWYKTVNYQSFDEWNSFSLNGLFLISFAVFFRPSFKEKKELGLLGKKRGQKPNAGAKKGKKRLVWYMYLLTGHPNFKLMYM